MFWLLTLLLAGPGEGAPPASAVNSSSVTVPTRPASSDVLPTDPMRRVRSGNRRITKLLEDGARRSRTFAALVSKIQQSDVIVYVEPSFGLAPDMAGHILLQVVAGNQRYLRVRVRATLQGDQMIAVIAHELQHALEVADDPAVVDDAGLIALYRRIGHVSNGTHSYDTDAARAAGRVVRDELTG